MGRPGPSVGLLQAPGPASAAPTAARPLPPSCCQVAEPGIRTDTPGLESRGLSDSKSGWTCFWACDWEGGGNGNACMEPEVVTTWS